MTLLPLKHRTAPPGTEFLHQLRAVLADLPLFVTAPLYRPLHLKWGATAAKVASALPGDDLLPRAQFQCTRAITIQAPPEAVFPWLIQAGCLRGGFYSNDLLDNLGRPSATSIIADLQDLEIGQWVPMSPTAPTVETAFKVVGFDVGKWLLLLGIKERAETLHRSEQQSPDSTVVQL